MSAPQGSEGSGLLPGLPDEVTINHIFTKLSWRMLYVGATVNSLWKQIVRSREVYNARVRAKSTETLVAFVHLDTLKKYSTWNQAISLYDPSMETWHLLPRLPGILNPVPWACACASLNGKLYVLGGWGKDLPYGNDVYCFDIAGQSGWRQCASMKEGRRSFASEVKDGKIYAFGGTPMEDQEEVCGFSVGFSSEVYDPVSDEWQSIAPMLSNRAQHKAVLYGDELYVQAGRLDTVAQVLRHGHYPQFAEVYNPRRDEWRRVENFITNNDRTQAAIAEVVVTIDGRLHKILDDALLVYEDSSQQWRKVQSISWETLQRYDETYRSNFLAQSTSAVVINGELMALVHCEMAERKFLSEIKPFRSEGLGRKDCEIKWRRVEGPLEFDTCHRMYALQL